MSEQNRPESNKPLPHNVFAERPAEVVGSHVGIFSPVIGSNQGGSVNVFDKSLKTTVAEQPSTDGVNSSGWLKKNLPEGLK